jgi:hypothetical protein
MRTSLRAAQALRCSWASIWFLAEMDCLSVNREGGALFHQSLTTWKTHWKARAVTVDSTITGISVMCGGGSDSDAGRIAGAASAARLGV